VQEEIRGMVGRAGWENGGTVMRHNSNAQHPLNNLMLQFSLPLMGDNRGIAR